MATTETDRQAPDEPRGESPRGLVDRWFSITERGSTVATEVRGGLTTFMAMAYIVILNPLILSGATDVNGEQLSVVGVTTMTAFSACIATLAMGVIGRVPLALAAALTVNAVLAYQIVPHVTWPQAMGLVVLEGLLIVILAVSGARTAIMRAIPKDLKHAIGVGLGLFIAFIGLVNAGFVTPGEGKPVDLGDGGVLTGWPIVVFAVGFLVMIALWSRRTPGSVLIGIVTATVLAMVLHSAVGLDDGEWGLVAPNLPDKIVSLPDFSLFGQVDIFGAITAVGPLTLFVFLFTLVLSGFFDAMGTIIAVGQEAKLTDEKTGQMRGVGTALTVDGFAAAFGGVTSSSANTVFVESAAGVGDGARTGLASVTSGAMFGVTMFLVPLAAVVPQQAAAPALVLVGGLMAMQARHIDWQDTEIAIPAFLIMAITPFTYSVTAGVGAGVISYIVIKVVRGKWREPGLIIWITGLVFLAYFGIDAIEKLFA
ncbi:NCS2 family permease [Salininema proteolyticum]|uniref:NCS2 family permease n=1 Tax=Salininema proteolyticum TaxID=1607685 RepID=A0ABV8U4U9_9ACTN